MEEFFKLIVIGDAESNSTSLTIQMVLGGTHTTKYDPTQPDGFTRDVGVDGTQYRVELYDASRQTAEFDQYFKNGDGFIVVYNVSSRFSFRAVEFFIERILTIKESNSVPIIVVGNLTSLTREVRAEEGEKLARDHGLKFFETNNPGNPNTEEALTELVRQIVRFRNMGQNTYYPRARYRPKKTVIKKIKKARYKTGVVLRNFKRFISSTWHRCVRVTTTRVRL